MSIWSVQSRLNPWEANVENPRERAAREREERERQDAQERWKYHRPKGEGRIISALELTQRPKGEGRIISALEVAQQLVAATTEPDERTASYLQALKDGEENLAWSFLTALQPPSAVDTLLRDACAAADTAGEASISVTLDERASALAVKTFSEAIERLNGYAREAEAAGQHVEADHLFAEAQNLQAHLDVLRDARIERGWSPDGDEAPEEPEAGPTA